MPQPSIKRACDQCHRRKIRCDGNQPCHSCKHLVGVKCTYENPIIKKGPKGGKASAINELRRAQRERSAALTSPLGSPTLSLQHDLLAPDVIEACITQFYDKLYYTIPICPRMWIDQHVAQMGTSRRSYCLVASLCVYIIVQPGLDVPSAPSSPDRFPTIESLVRQPIDQAQEWGMSLVQNIRENRARIELPDTLHTASIMTSFFLSAGLFGLQMNDLAWIYLQEAIAFAMTMRIHDETSYDHDEPTLEDHVNRRLFWLTFISERAQALHKHREVKLHESISFPETQLGPTRDLGISGLTCLYRLFRIVDDNVSEIWNKLRAQSDIKWPPNIALLLAEKQRDLTTAIPPDIELTEVQEADLRITREWLRTVIWQLSTASGCLSSTATEMSMTLHYPADVARELVRTISKLSLKSMEAHGLGLIEKIFDVAYALCDVISLIPVDPSTSQEDLKYLLTMLSQLHNAKSVGLLKIKIRETLPQLAVNIGLAPASSSSITSVPTATTRPALPQHISLPPLRRLEGAASAPTTPFGSPWASPYGSPASLHGGGGGGDTPPPQLMPTSAGYPVLAPILSLGSQTTVDTPMSDSISAKDEPVSPAMSNLPPVEALCGGAWVYENSRSGRGDA